MAPEEQTSKREKKTGPSPDLSTEIELAVQRRPSDKVKCTRVSGDNYRCNWWSPADTTGYDNPRMSGMLVTTHLVRQSRFLCATKTAEGLVIQGM